MVAPSSTALTVPIVALAATVPRIVSPATESTNGPTRDRLAAAVDERHERGDEQHEQQHAARAAPDRAAAARGRPRRAATSASAQPAYTGHASSGADTATQRDPDEAEQLRARVEPVDRAGGVAGRPGQLERVAADARSRAAPAAA